LVGRDREQQVYLRYFDSKLGELSDEFMFIGEVYQRKIRDLRYMQQWKNKQHMRLGVQNNMQQHHFREQVNF
jgi:hypothetical protein